MLKDKITSKKVIVFVTLLVVALLSITVVSKYATSAEVHSSAIEALEQKKVTAMQLTAGVAATSTAITALPGDAATPIAEQVSQLTDPLLVVICAIYLEKFLLTTIGYLSFKILIPIACAFGIISIFWSKGELKAFAMKLGIFALAISVVIPASVKVTQLIETTFADSIHQTYETADEITGEAEKSSEEKDSGSFMEFLKGIGSEVSDLAENAKNALSVFIDAIAVLIITTCVIPILVILFFLWLIKMIFGIKVDFQNMKKMIPMKSSK